MPANQQTKEKIRKILRQAFPEDTVDVSDGYNENIHIVVMSREFDNKGEKEKQEYLWSLIDKSNLTKEEKSMISLIIPLSPSEVK